MIAFRLKSNIQKNVMKKMNQNPVYLRSRYQGKFYTTILGVSLFCLALLFIVIDFQKSRQTKNKSQKKAMEIIVME